MGQALALTRTVRILNEDELLLTRAREAKLIPVPMSKAKVFEPNKTWPGQDWRTMNVLSKGLSFDLSVINQLYSLFCMADLDHGGTIDLLEFCHFLGVEKSRFNALLFSIFDMDGSGEVDFLEFCCALWNVATWAEEDLALLMFYLYDKDRSGTLTRSECEQMVGDVFAARKGQGQGEAALLLESLDEITEAGMYAAERVVRLEPFLAWCGRHEEALHPLRCVWLVCRNRVLGSEYWDNIGRAARKATMEHLVDIVRNELGPPGAAEAVERCLAEMDRQRDKALQRRQHEALFGAGPAAAGVADVPGLARSREETKYRVLAMSLLHVERSRRYAAWDAAAKRVLAKGDPLSVLLRFEHRTLAQDLRAELESPWAAAMQGLQGKTYDREGRLAKLVAGKPPKARAYLMRKDAKYLSAEERCDSDRRFSVAGGKRTWVEQHREAKARARAEFIGADGNRHLSRHMHGPQLERDEEDGDEPDARPAAIEWKAERESRLRRELAALDEVFQRNVTTTTRAEAAARKNQYREQNVKRPPLTWKLRTYKWLKDEASGEHLKREPSDGGLPWRPPKRGGHKGATAKVFASPPALRSDGRQNERLS
jgi:Ca2+-binding EF-hand superfamily protein